MKLGKLALWAFIALLLSGVVFGAGIANDIKNNNGTLDWQTFVSGSSHLVDTIETAPINDTTNIVVLSSYPEIQVVTSSTDQVTARLHGSLHLQNESGIPELTLRQSGKNLTIEVKSKTSNIIGYVSGNLKLVVTIPENYKKDLSVKSTSGSIRLETLQMETLTVHSTSGSIDISDVSAGKEITVSSTSGSITSNEIIAAERLHMNSTSGSIHASVLKNAMDMQMKSTSGNIELQLAVSDDIDMDAKTSSGSISSSISLNDVKHRDDRLIGKTGNGSHKIQLEASSGSISVQ